MTLTADFTFQLSDTGVVLNTDPPGNFVDITKVSGLDNAPFRTAEQNREDMDGGFIDVMYEKMRTIVLEGFVYGNELFLDTLKANFAPTMLAQPFYFTAPGISQRLAFVKSLGMRYNWETLRRTGRTPAQFMMQAEDPTLFGSLISGSASLGGTSTGFGFPFGFPFGFGGTSSVAGAASIVNAGNKPTDATFIIPGPITNPALVHDESGNRLSLNTTVAVGDWLTINLRNKSIRLNDVANRRGILLGTSRWFLLAPGTNTVRFLGTSTGSPVMTYTTRPAYR